MNESYTLQLRHGAEAKNFSTRDEVFDYVNGQINYGGVQLLPYEPVLFFYGDDDAKNTAIIVGLPEGKTFKGNKYFVVDTAALKEQIEAVDKKYDEAIEGLKAEDEKLWEAVNQEITDRIAADKAEEEARIAADEAEAEARAQKDTELEQAIADEEAARIAADKAEEEARIKKDAELEDEINYTKDDLKSVIEACGLIYNERLATDRVSYEPDSHDEVIRDAKDITEAIDKVSKFVAKVAKDLKVSVEDTQTIKFTMTPNEKDGGNVISADVRIAGSEGLSKKNLDNNIIGQTSEGLYASATLEPGDKPNTLVFKKSGYINGQFVVDAYETEVPLFVYDGDGGKETGIAINVDGDKNKIKAQLNLSSKESNILKLEDGEYSVDGTAKNIKYKDTTVFHALKNHEAELEEIKDVIDFVKAVDVKGSETGSAVVNVDKTAKGDFTVKTDVKLSNDNSIVVANGGLKADVSASYDSNSCIMTLSVGNTKQAIDLSSLAVSAIEDAYYNAANEEVVIVFRVGVTTKTVRIPVATLIHDVDVRETTTLDLHLETTVGGKDVISGDVKIDTTLVDNILTKGRNGLYVSGSNITNAVKAEAAAREQADAALAANIQEAMNLINANKTAITAETSRAQAAETANANAIANEKYRAEEKEADLLAKVTENKTVIDNEVSRARAEEIALKTAIDNNKAAIAAEEARAKAAETENASNIAAEISRATTAEGNIIKEVNSEAVRAQAAEAVLSDSIKVCQNKADEAAAAVRTEESRAKDAENALDAKIAEVTSAVNAEAARAQAAEQVNATAIVAEKSRAEEKEADLLAKITDNTAKIVENKTAINAETTRAQNAEDALKGSIDTNKTAIATEEARAKAAEVKNASDIAAEVTRATEKENDLAEKIDASASKADDNAKAIAAETARAIAAENEIATSVNAAKAAVETEAARAKAAEEANATAIETEKNRATEKENGLQAGVDANKTAIENEVKRATDAESALEGRIDEINLNIEKETVRAKAAEEANATAIETEKNRAEAAEKTLNDNIAVQQAYTKRVEDALNAHIEESGKDLEVVKAELNSNIDKKANSVDVYTKEEMLERLASYAQTDDVQSKLDEKLNITDAQNIYATKDALQNVKDTYATLQHVDEADAQLSERVANSEGALDNINLTYNAATSELVYTNKSGVATTFKLYSGSLIKKGEFDPRSNSIVLTIENAGIESQITIPVSELLSDLADKIKINSDEIQKINEALAKLAKDWTVENTSTVSLVKSTVGEQDVLSANVLVASSNKQAIQSTGNGLYVSNDLEDFTCVFGAEGTISGQNAISKLLESFNSLKSELIGRIEAVENSVIRLSEKVESNSEKIALAMDSIKDIKDNLAEIKANVAENKRNIESAKADIARHESELASQKTLIIENKTAIEEIKAEMGELIDAGTY